jgi:hypothetical protein
MNVTKKQIKRKIKRRSSNIEIIDFVKAHYFDGMVVKDAFYQIFDAIGEKDPDNRYEALKSAWRRNKTKKQHGNSGYTEEERKSMLALAGGLSLTRNQITPKDSVSSPPVFARSRSHASLLHVLSRNLVKSYRFKPSNCCQSRAWTSKPSRM